MTSLENLGTVLKADLLIVGGGIAGLACAISAKEADPEVDVLIVDKVVTGWGGKANKGGGNIVFVDPAELGNVLDFHVHNVGDFLEDQDLLMDFARETRGNLEKLESWGVHIYRDDDGEPKYVRWLPRASRGAWPSSTRTSRSTWPSTRASSACASRTAWRSSTCSRTATGSAARSASA